MCSQKNIPSFLPLTHKLLLTSIILLIANFAFFDVKQNNDLENWKKTQSIKSTAPEVCIV